MSSCESTGSIQFLPVEGDEDPFALDSTPALRRVETTMTAASGVPGSEAPTVVPRAATLARLPIGRICMPAPSVLSRVSFVSEAPTDSLSLLSAAQVDAIYDLVDLDEDGCITPSDLYAFLALNPACIDDATKARRTPTPFSPQLKLQQGRPSDSPELRLLHGQRADMALRDRLFVEFFLKMSFSVLSKRCSSPGGSQAPAMTSSSFDAFALGTNRDPLSTFAVPPFVSREALHALMHEVEGMLSIKDNACMFVIFDMPMLRAVRSFMKYARDLCERSGMLDEATATAADPAKSLLLAEAAGSIHTHSSCSSAIYWMLGSWAQRRGVFDVPVMQRFGEVYLKRLATKHRKRIAQFTRYYRHLLQNNSSHSRRDGRKGAHASLSLLRLSSKFLTSSLNGLGDTKSPSNSRSPSHGTDTPRPSSHRRKEASVQNDYVIHALVDPDPLTQVGVLGAKERAKITRSCQWAMFRAAVYGLLAAVVIGCADTLVNFFFLKESDSVGDAVLRSVGTTVYSVTDALFGSAPFGNHSLLAKTGVATNGTALSRQAIGDFVTNDQWLYKLVLFLISTAVSLTEVVLLLMDNLRTSFAMCRDGGIPVQHFAPEGASTIRADESELAAVRDDLGRKRVGFVMTALCRAAVEAPFSARSILGVRVSDSNVTWLSRVWSVVWPKIKRTGPTFVLRVGVARVLSQYFLPFLSTPMLVFWNWHVASLTLGRAREVIFGAIGAEALASELLDTFFGHLPVVHQHNARIHEQQQTAIGCRAGGGVAITGLYYVPIHVYREMVFLIAFTARIVGSHTIHPSVHIFLVYVATHIQAPDAACGFTCDDAGRAEKALGSSCDALLCDWMASMSRQLNAADGAVRKDIEWAQRFADLHTHEPSYEAMLKDLASRVPAVVPSRATARDSARLQHLLEVCFPAWCCPSLNLRWLQEPLLGSDPRTQIFSLEHVRLFLITAVLCVVMASGERSLHAVEKDFLQLLLRAYLSHQEGQGTAGSAPVYGSSAEHEAWQAKAAVFVDGVAQLSIKYHAGIALRISHIAALIASASS